jgi:mannose-6-phosphate isomerase
MRKSYQSNWERNLNSISSKLLSLKGFPNFSKWGRVGEQSAIFPFLKEERCKDLPLAELWFGTHKNGLSTVSVEGEELSLRDYLNNRRKFSELPYLAKILSVDAPLSIQLHPPKLIAEELHAKDPKNYPDSNPKPEMSIALTKVELLCGVRTIEAIREIVSQQDAFKALGPDFSNLLDGGSLRPLANFIFNLDQAVLDEFCKLVLKSTNSDPWTNIVRKLSQLGEDVDPGIVFVYFLEFITLKPGEAIFIEPGVPHAYVSGDMFECMQSSDNVIRGGLTPKFIDKENFVKIFTESFYDPNLVSVSLNCINNYSPVNCPFSVKHICTAEKFIVDIEADSIIIIIQGKGSLIIEGELYRVEDYSSYFIPTKLSEIEFSPQSFFEVFVVEPE